MPYYSMTMFHSTADYRPGSRQLKTFMKLLIATLVTFEDTLCTNHESTTKSTTKARTRTAWLTHGTRLGGSAAVTRTACIRHRRTRTARAPAAQGIGGRTRREREGQSERDSQTDIVRQGRKGGGGSLRDSSAPSQRRIFVGAGGRAPASADLRIGSEGRSGTADLRAGADAGERGG